MIKLSNQSAGIRTILLLVIAFGLSGAASAWMFTSHSDWIGYSAGAPFAVATVLFFAGTPRLAPLLLVFNSLSWVIAIQCLRLAANNLYVVVGLAGFVGGICVALSTGVSCRALLSLRKILTMGLAGAVAATPFDFMNESIAVSLYASFVVWQVVTGVFLHLLSAPRQAR